MCGRGRKCWSRLAARLDSPRSLMRDGTRKFRDYKDFIVRFEGRPGSDFSPDGAARTGSSRCVGAPNPRQWEAYIENQSLFSLHVAGEDAADTGYANKDYLEFAEKHALLRHAAGAGHHADVLGAAAEVPARGAGPLRRPAADGRRRPRAPRASYFDPLPFWYAPLEKRSASRASDYPFHAITQRPMVMYHSWDAQNAWLRQIIAENACT